MSNMEEWRPVVGYEGLYEVSDTGLVRSLPKAVVTTDRWGNARINRRRERVMKPAYRKGYAGITLTKDGRQRVHRVNRLVLLAFVGPPPSSEATLACHEDGDPADNSVGNLYWGTPQQNIDDVFRHGRKMRSLTRNRIRPKQAKVTVNQVRGVKLLLAAGKSATVIARNYGVSVQLIRSIKYSRTWRNVSLWDLPGPTQNYVHSKFAAKDITIMKS